MPKQHYRACRFYKSAATIDQLPEDTGMEVAFSGCSNAGKSSTLNAITDNKHLAKISKTPGRTQLLNVFSLDDQRRLIDLPGYGYAKVASPLKQAWHDHIDAYLRQRHSLRGLILVGDIRHPLKPFEEQMIDWASHTQTPLLFLLNKADKLSKSAIAKTRQQVTQVVSGMPGIHIHPFSAAKKTGLETVYGILDAWFALAECQDQ